MGDLIKITLTSLIAALACTGIIYAATTVGTNISTTGTLTATGLTTMGNASSTLFSVSNTGYIGGSNGLILADGSITDASGSIDFGNEQLTTTGNIGIGTTSPYAKLSVVGEVVGSYFTATSTTATSTFANGIYITSGCFRGVDGSCVTGGGSTSPGGSDTQMQYNNGGSSFGGASGFVWDDSNLRVGIGTTSPYAKLSVVGQTVAEYFTATSTTATSTFSGGLEVTGIINCTDISCSGGLLLNDASADGDDDFIIDDDSGNVLFKIDVSEGTVRRPTRASLVVVGADTIPADACGGTKRISSAADVTTNTTNTFTAAATINDGCMMSVQNTGSYAITLDGNSEFNNGYDYILNQGNTVEVYSTGNSGAWFVISEGNLSGERVVTRTITSAQLLAMNATPITLIPAVADYIIDVEKVWVKYNRGTAAYADIAADEDFRIYLNNFGTLTVLETTGFLDQLTSDRMRMGKNHFPTGDDATVIADPWDSAHNQPLNISILGSTEITTGDGTLTITIFYRLVKY